MRARIWTGDGRSIDGSVYDSRADALDALREWRGWSTVYTVAHGRAVSCYGSQDDADVDRDGAFADTVSDIE